MTLNVTEVDGKRFVNTDFYLDVNNFLQYGPTEMPTIVGYMESNAYAVTNALVSDPTPENLDQLMIKYPNYRLSHGGRLGYTALAVAIEQKALPLIHHILDLEPTLVNGSTVHNTPYLAWAAKREDPEAALKIVRELLKRGAKLNLVDELGRTALYYSMQQNSHRELTQFLMKKGAVIYKSSTEIESSSLLNNLCFKILQRKLISILKTEGKCIREELIGRNMFLNNQLDRENSIPLIPEIRAYICSFLD